MTATTRPARPADRPLRAAIYKRASLDKTGERNSVQRQGQACRGLAAARGWNVVAEIEDNSISAYDTGKVRPGWNAIMDMIERDEIDVVIAWHLDRVTRSMDMLSELIRIVETTGVGLATATGDIDLTTDVGRMIARILTAVAMAEVERKAARQQLANEQRAAQGVPWTNGPRPFGYEADGLTVREVEAEAFRWAVQSVLDGSSLGQVGRDLSARGLCSTRSQHSKTGHGWTHSGLRKMMISPRYAGVAMFKGKPMGTCAWPALIDMDTHLAIVRKLTDPARDKHVNNPGGRGPKPQTLLTSIATCDQCEQYLIATTHRGIARYMCASRKGHLLSPRAGVDNAVSDAVVGLLTMPGFAATLVPSDDEGAAAAQRDLDRAHRRLRVVNDQFADGVYDDAEDEYRRITTEIRATIKSAKAALAERSNAKDFVGLDLGTPEVDAQWIELSLERKRAIIDRLFDIRVRPVDHSRDPWTEARHLSIVRKV